GALRHRAVWTPGSPEEHASAVIETTNTVDAAHHGQFARAGIVRAAGHLFVDGLQRGSADLDDHFAFARNWLGELLETRRFPESMQYGGIHQRFPVSGNGILLSRTHPTRGRPAIGCLAYARGCDLSNTSIRWRIDAWVYFCVVESERCPSSSWMARRSAPSVSRCVAKAWRKACACAFHPVSSSRVYFFTMRSTDRARSRLPV